MTVALFMGWKRLAIVRKLKSGFELLDGTDATDFVETMVECWKLRPEGSDLRIKVHIDETMAMHGYRVT